MTRQEHIDTIRIILESHIGEPKTQHTLEVFRSRVANLKSTGLILDYEESAQKPGTFMLVLSPTVGDWLEVSIDVTQERCPTCGSLR